MGIVEVAGVLARKEREHEITAAERQQYLGLFALDCQHCFSLLPLTGLVLRLAATLTHRQALRAYDAVHLASAMLANQLLVNTGATLLTVEYFIHRYARKEAKKMRSLSTLGWP
jgi:predicted nucleic acid-binding protein